MIADLGLVIDDKYSARAQLPLSLMIDRQNHSKCRLPGTARDSQVSIMRPRNPVSDAETETRARNLTRYGGLL